MSIPPSIPRPQLIPDEQLPRDPAFMNLALLRHDKDQSVQDNWLNNRYEFLQRQEKRHFIKGAVLSLKGAAGTYRLAATIHGTLAQLKEIIRYDPSQPPGDDFEAIGMQKAHLNTQADFKNAKSANLDNFRDYLVESMRGERTAFLPVISGWQSDKVFPETIFVAFDEITPYTFYGNLYLPKAPIMQSDGQTQTAALFRSSITGIAKKTKADDTFIATLEVELNCDEAKAGQSFADRNGRGSKKSNNLVSALDNSSALAQIRNTSIKSTVFDGRVSDGKSRGGKKRSPTENVVDLSTLDQMLMGVICKQSKKPEQIKGIHVDALTPWCKEFINLLSATFGPLWVHPTPTGQDAFKKLYIHSWPFALKALAEAYHDVRIDKLGPIVKAISAPGVHDTSKEASDAFEAAVESSQATAATPTISFSEFCVRLKKIDWLRHRAHWIAITGAKTDKAGRKKVIDINVPVDGKIRGVEGAAQNTKAVVSAVRNKILSNTWQDLCSLDNEPV
jgi:hypothetical protein